MIPMTKKKQNFLLGHPMASLDNNGEFSLIIWDNGTYNWNGEIRLNDGGFIYSVIPYSIMYNEIF